MNTDLRKTICTQIKRESPTNMKGYLELLRECGATPQDKQEIENALNEFKLDGPAIYAKFNAEYRAYSLQQPEEKRISAVWDRLIEVKTIISELEHKGALTAEERAEPLQDLLKAARTAVEVNDPRKDRAAILRATTRDEVIQKIKNKPAAHETGYTIKGEPLRFQTGALSIIAAPTGHGKTTMLINLLLDAAQRYPDKRHWLFSYEEGQAAVMIKALNTYCAQDYSGNNRRTIESYYRGDSSFFGLHDDNGITAPRLPHFEEREPLFWKLVEEGTINIIPADYPTEELIRVIDTLAEDRPGLIGIDYLQLLYPANRDRYTGRTEELKRICLDLKDSAVQEGLAIIAAAQFNREVRYPRDMEAQKLADASDIEKAANKVIGIWNGDKKPHGKEEKDGSAHIKDHGIKKGRLYMEVLKARDEPSDIWGTYEYNGNQGVIEKLPIVSGCEGSSQEADKIKNKGKDTWGY